MFKLAVFFALVACAFAAPKPGIFAHEPVVAVAHSVPVATSYSNSYQTVVKSPVVASYAAPAYYKAYSAHPAPVAYAAHAAPLAYSSYAAPVAHYAHAAPLAYTAHAAPLAYAAHAAPLAYYH